MSGYEKGTLVQMRTQLADQMNLGQGFLGHFLPKQNLGIHELKFLPLQG